jgi:hypothetical protein
MKYLFSKKKKFKWIFKIVCNGKCGLLGRISKNLDEIYEKVFKRGFIGF